MLQRGRLFKNVVRFQRSRGLAKSHRAGQIQRIIEIGPRAVFSKVNSAPAYGRYTKIEPPTLFLVDSGRRKGEVCGNDTLVHHHFC